MPIFIIGFVFLRCHDDWENMYSPLKKQSYLKYLVKYNDKEKSIQYQLAPFPHPLSWKCMHIFNRSKVTGGAKLRDSFLYIYILIYNIYIIIVHFYSVFVFQSHHKNARSQRLSS